MADKVGDAFRQAQKRLTDAQDRARQTSAELAEKARQEALQRAGGGAQS